MKIDTRIDVEPEDCLDALNNYVMIKTIRYDSFLPEEFVKLVKELYDEVMKKWIPIKERCKNCSGFRFLGPYDDTCYDCDGTGRRKNETK